LCGLTGLAVVLAALTAAAGQPANPPAPAPAVQPTVQPTVPPAPNPQPEPPAPKVDPKVDPPAPAPVPLKLKVTSGAGQTILTNEIPTLTLIEIAVESRHKLLWFPPPGLQVRPDSSGKAITVFFTAPGEYRFVVTERTEMGQGLDQTFKAVGKAPTPPTPDKVDPPAPKPDVTPIPAGQFRVLFVWESESNNGRELLNIIYSTKIAKYLNEKCVKVDNHPEWRRWDQNIQVVEKSTSIEELKTAVMNSPTRPPVPFLVIANGSDAKTFPLTGTDPSAVTTEDAVLDLLKKYGGN
jgi:hypothetical protein